MRLFQALIFIQQELKKNNISNLSSESIIIAKYALKKDDLFILTNPDFQITKLDYNMIIRIVEKRLLGYPMAYIIHKKEFMGLELYINKNVLIPRPETENIVEEVIRYIKDYNFKSIIDVCCGSGAIGISVEHYTKVFTIIADISYKALKVANINKKLLRSKVLLVSSDLLSAFKSKVDLIVSNPPYIKFDEFDSLQKEVKNEPKIALLCDENYSIIRKIIEQSRFLTKYLVLEIAPNMRNFLEEFSDLLYIKKDYGDNDRIAVFRF